MSVDAIPTKAYGAPVHPDEERRMQVLRGLDILDTGTYHRLSGFLSPATLLTLALLLVLRRSCRCGLQPHCQNGQKKLPSAHRPRLAR